MMTLRKRNVCLWLLTVLCGGVFLLYLLQSGLRIPCPVYTLTGLQCPGCGNTRATLALLRLDFQSVLRYNLLYPLEMLYLLWVAMISVRNYLRTGRFSYRAPCPALDISFLGLILLWTIVRNIAPFC
jgi:hypothetical protein